MNSTQQFTSVTFRNYKAFKKYTVSLGDFNVLVGPNNSGKSTIIGAFRILVEGMRKASKRKPEFIHLEGVEILGYQVPLEDLPVATENIFSNYDESQPAIVEFKLTGGNKLSLVFPEQNLCYLVCDTEGPSIKTPSIFRKEYSATVGFVPVLGPVEHNEPLYLPEAAKRALLTHRASRNFRNIWHHNHNDDDFEEFRNLLRSSWPGMDIEKPIVEFSGGKPTLYIFCPEERFPREIYWAGFGFQVWCQMLTYIIKAKNDSLLIIDEPDIYLHSDLQRQLVGLLKTIGPDILIATHSTEIISEADPGDLLVINKKLKSARRIKDPTQLQNVFEVLGSNLNPTLTQLAKSRRAVFIEGKDFQIFSAFARRLNKQSIANRTDFAAIPVEGFNPQKVSDFSKGIEMTLGGKLKKAIIFDRDYRSEEEVSNLKVEMSKFANLVHIHNRKEIENYLLEPAAIDKALARRIKEHNRRRDDKIECTESTQNILELLTEELKSKVSGQFLAKRHKYERRENPAQDHATINQKLLEDFEKIWTDFASRINIIPGKEILSRLNKYIQTKYKVTLTPTAIIREMHPDEVPEEIRDLINSLDDFRKLET